MNKIYIVRHGETDWNKEGRCQGKTNISLNENGITQAENLKNKFDISKIDVCFVSPLKESFRNCKNYYG